jgi:hypothetical protein
MDIFFEGDTLKLTNEAYKIWINLYFYIKIEFIILNLCTKQTLGLDGLNDKLYQIQSYQDCAGGMPTLSWSQNYLDNKHRHRL